MSEEKSPLLSILIVHYETPEYTQNLLKNLDNDPDVEILLIDNSRTDKIKESINADFPYIKYFYTGRNLGFSGGINYGLLEASGEWIFVLNSDTKVSVQDIKKLLMITQKNNCLVSAPRLISKDGTVQNNVGELPSLTKNPIDWIRNRPDFFESKTISEEKEITLLSGTAMLFNKSVIDEIGYFDDENYFIDFVDFDFSNRLAEHKIKILYVPQVSVVHYTSIPFEPAQKGEARLTVLGSGTSLSGLYHPFDFRNPPGYLIQTKTKNILFECSEGIRARLDSIRFDYFKIDTIIISHFHPDHFVLNPFIQALFVRALGEKQTKVIDMYGPPGIEEITLNNWNQIHGSNTHYDDLKKYLSIQFHELSNEKISKLGTNIEMTSYEVKHDRSLQCFAFKVLINDTIFTYSGDTEICEGIKKASENSSFFLCEAACNREQRECSGHLTVQKAGNIAKEGNVKHLILTHYSGSDLPSEIKSDIKESGYQGETTVAKDFQEFYL